ncbi:S-adenosyl-L-methionine-dependent methyltransferase [Mycena venus]|uniref:S-adenosyl-L-methionine-dependent methyltransferase n=1 Tax=Mycena venus TaxID=2733690 RepID=A0A8H6YLT6_9AGAR|nr:S-adenosyl-L-methionine-dependent methyltransferase [Mycena venus]
MGEPVYTLKTARERTEKNRLDELHVALRDTSPTRILELGCGSGAWAIDAATDFPDAEVVAVDLSPTLEGIPLPKNIKFQIVDATQSFPFEQNSFDVVHSRFVLMHVPNARDAMERAARLVKPGGWVVFEDVNLRRLIETSGTAVSRVMNLWAGIAEARGADAHIGKKMESIVRDTGLFSEIHARKIVMPLCNRSSASPTMTRLAEAFRTSIQRLVADWSQRFSEEGISKEVAEQFDIEIDADSPEAQHELYFVWARRTL